MEIRKASPAQIRRQGLEALMRTLGPVGTVRFLQQFDTGGGDYTRDREQWLKEITVQDAIEAIKRRRKKSAR